MCLTPFQIVIKGSSINSENLGDDPMKDDIYSAIPGIDPDSTVSRYVHV